VCLDRLLATVGSDPPRAIALTHIHLDHAGATGSLLRRYPQAEVWVHERGAPHVVDPSRLLASATRLWGEDMQRLWGAVEPVPAQRVRALHGGEQIGPFQVAYTPGHASHHVSFLHEGSGRAFTGDVTGVRIGDGPVIAPTPPPDFDYEAWQASLDLIAAWRPSGLCITHFGGFEHVDEHLAAVRESLARSLELGRLVDERDFVAAQEAQMPEPAYAQATVAEHNWQGVVRHLRKQAAAANGG
jgi:glyoxylase-like metal-dependent hydrolase (beta-lactamase superfamily II)